MATPAQFISLCAAEIGNNGTKYNMWKWGYIQPAWCATGLSWVNVVQLGGPLGFDSGAVSTVRSQRLPEVAANSLSGVKVGDLACYNWNGRTDRGWMDHIEVVEWVNPANGQFGTIGFNTDNIVKRVTRTVHASYFVCFVRPAYDGANTPTTGGGGSTGGSTSSGSKWMSQIGSGNWRNEATTSSGIFATYGVGAQVECVGWVYGQDPYGTGQNRWVKSKNNGKYAWEGLFSRASVDSLGQLNGSGGSASSGGASGSSGSYWMTQTQAGNWRNDATSNSGLFATYGYGAQVECVGFVYGQDPYGTGQNRWVKSKNNGKYCWEGNFSASAVNALPQL